MNKDNPVRFDLYNIDLISGELTLIKKNPGNISGWLIDNFSQLRGIVLNKDDGNSDLMVKMCENDDWKKILTWHMEDMHISHPICFSGDNNYIYILDTQNSNTSQLIKMEINTGKKDVMVCDPEYDIHLAFRNPQMNKYDLNIILLNPDTNEVQAICIDKYRKEWIVLDEDIKSDFEAIRTLSLGDFNIISRNYNDKIWIIAFEKDNKPTSYYIYDREIKKGQFLFFDNPVLNNYKLSPMEEVVFISRDGLTIQGYIAYPEGYERKNLPMVLFVHSGPWYRDKWGYNPTAQWFTNRGYVCLQINYRGSVGYGKEFFNAGNKEWGGKMQNDLEDGVNWAVKKGIADPSRIAVYGSGYGGYAALSGAVFTPDLFCCAVAIECPGNLVTMLQSTPPTWKNSLKKLIKRIGDPDLEKDLLISRSPISKLESIKIPLLISHGLKNQRIKSSESYQIVNTMKRKGLSVEYIVFPDEGYGMNKHKNRMKFYGVTEKFLAAYMRGRYEPRDTPYNDIYIQNTTHNIFNDKILIDKILNEGDNMAFKKLQEYYEKPLIKYLFSITRDLNTSKELMQEVFCRVWLYISSYSFDMPFSSWLFKIAKNVTRTYQMKKRNLLNNEVFFDEIDFDTIEGYKEDIENKIFIQSAVNSMKEPYKTSLLLRYMEELDYNEIASIMQINPRQVKNNLYRAKKSLLKFWMKSPF